MDTTHGNGFGKEHRMNNDHVRSGRDLATMAGNIARAIAADATICATDDGELVRHLRSADPDRRLIAASLNTETLAALASDGIEVVAMATKVVDRYRQARLVAGLVLTEGLAEPGELVVCVVGHRTSLGGGDLIMVTDLDETSQVKGVGDLVSLTDGLSPTVLDRLLDVADRIGRVSQRGTSLGALFVIGDSDHVLEGSRQLVLNPLQGHDDDRRRITDASLADTLVELAKLDGAFVLRGDGLILTGGVFLATGGRKVDVPAGLGTRHVTAAGVTARTKAVAVVVSATDGAIRVFSGGQLVLQRRPTATMPAYPRTSHPDEPASGPD